MGKATTNAVDFLAAISGETDVFETDGVTVELRSLTFAETQRLGIKHKNDNTELAFQALALGLVKPSLTPEQIEQLRQAKPGPLMKIAKRVMEISGMVDEEGGSPLAGSGSLNATGNTTPS